MNRLFLSMGLTALLAVPVFGQNAGLQIALSNGVKYRYVSIDSLDGNALVITPAGMTLRIPVDSVARVTTRMSGNVLRGISIGLVVGAATGFVAGILIDNINYSPYKPDKGETHYKTILPFVGGAVGRIIGQIIGSSHHENSVDLAGRTVEEKKLILIPLSRQIERPAHR